MVVSIASQVSGAPKNVNCVVTGINVGYSPIIDAVGGK